MTFPSSGSGGRVVALVLVAATAAAGWLLRDRVRALWEGDDPANASPQAPATPDGGGDTVAAGPDRPEERAGTEPDDRSGDVAASGGRDPGDRPRAGGTARGERDARRPAADPTERLRRFFAAAGPGSIRLDSADLAMLLGPRRSRPLPPGVSEPSAVPRDSVLEASANVDLERAVGDRLPAMVRRMIGDSARVRAVLSPAVLEPGKLRISVRDVRAGSVTFPQAMVPWLLGQMNVPTAADDPSAAEFRAAAGLAGARVEDGFLVLVREPGG